ncbi:MAG TPA: redoxin family protein [Chitinophagaceae bacterium]
MRLLHVLTTILLLATVTEVAGQKKLELIPANPQRGEKVTIRYNPAAEGATIPAGASGIDIVFTYSNLYEYPWRMPLQKNGSFWETSFIVPHYATYATFYLQSGDQKDVPGNNRHYELPVYTKNKRVENSYLYESYSLGAQLGKVPELEQKKAELLQKELQAYPNNYEAKLRLMNYKISTAAGKDKETYRKQARAIIAAKFLEKPGNMGFMNKTTMGYLIIGENSRLDSIREIAKLRYPDTEVGYSMQISEISKESDSLTMVKRLHQLLKKQTPANKSFFSGAHEILFKYYASRQDADKALYHLSQMNTEFTPYTPENVKEQAEILYRSNLALETALRLAKHALVLADTFPTGLIRHFPETGYIPSFVSREQRQAVTVKATANAKALIGLIRLQQGLPGEAQVFIEDALALSKDAETLKHGGEFYQKTGAFQKAFTAYRSIVLDTPEDTAALNKMKTAFLAMGKDAKAWEKEMDELNAHWKKGMLARLKKEIINLPAPEFIGSLVDLKGNPVAADLIKDKIVVVDFWATWCVPCMHEMPYIQNAYSKYKDRDDVLFMVINSGSNNSLQDAQGWWGNKRYSFPVFYNKDRSIGEKFGFNVIPATYIIDKKGNVRFKTIGFEGPVVQRKIEVAIEMLQAGDL